MKRTLVLTDVQARRLAAICERVAEDYTAADIFSKAETRLAETVAEKLNEQFDAHPSNGGE